MRIGLVFSDKTAPNQAEFSFIASREVAAGEFVEARTPNAMFLGLVSAVRISNPDYEGLNMIHHVITKKPEAEFDTKSLEVYGEGMRIATVRVLGTFDVETNHFDFTGRVVPPGTEVHSAEPARLSRALSEDTNGLNIGHVYGTAEVTVSIPLSSLYHHLAIVGSTGSGKSYAGAVICEELALKRLSVVVIDPHGEYASLGLVREPGNDDAKLAPWKGATVKEFTPSRGFMEGTTENLLAPLATLGR